jgi:hypothetical protein
VSLRQQGLDCSLALKTPGTNGLSQSHEGTETLLTRGGSCHLSLRQQGLDCARVLIVVPYADDEPAGASVSVAELDDAAGGE